MLFEQAKLRDFAARYTAAWCSHDAPSVADFFARNGSLSVNGGAAAVGREAITKVVEGFMSAFPDLQILLDRIAPQGDRAAYHWILIGTNTGPGGAGRRVRISGYELWKMGEDECIAESQGHFDAAEYQHQLEHGAGSR